jgi:hypothetical protein
VSANILFSSDDFNITVLTILLRKIKMFLVRFLVHLYIYIYVYSIHVLMLIGC